MLVARRQQRLEALAAEIETASGLKPWVLALDLTESAELSRLMDFLETRSVTPEIFINNAGFGDFGPMVDADEERISRMLRLNIAALTGLSIEAARAMKRLGRGRILNVASTAAFQACPGFGVYAATKAYVVSFTESLSEELRCYGLLSRPDSNGVRRSCGTRRVGFRPNFARQMGALGCGMRGGRVGRNASRANGED